MSSTRRTPTRRRTLTSDEHAAVVTVSDQHRAAAAVAQVIRRRQIELLTHLARDGATITALAGAASLSRQRVQQLVNTDA
ncbi:hypothetical protein [Cellulomonas hominis]